MDKHFVFVYGTLRRGGSRAMSVSFPAARFVAFAKVRGSLYDLGAFPGLLLNHPNSSVSGEVYEVTDETLSALDDFEASSHYRREEVETTIGTQRTICWTYVPDPEFYSFASLITSGDWVEHAKFKTDG